MDGGGLEVGAAVWIADKDEVWRSATIQSFNVDKAGAAGSVTVEVKDEGKRGTVARQLEVQRLLPDGQAALHPRNEALKTRQGCIAFNDLSHLPLLHEPALLHALEVRFQELMVYTLTGPVLLAVNPFRKIEDLYGAERLKTFVELAHADTKKTDDAPSKAEEDDQPEPHIFGVALVAYQGVWRQGANQTVLISGESGAGKTETTKFVMRFLALAGAGGAEASMSDVERQVLGSIPLLEALGNAKTLRNDNSSRFGKYIELQFGGRAVSPSGAEPAPRLLGAHTHTYLLEKVRVTAQQGGERSFHVFYQMLAAAKASGASGADPAEIKVNGGSLQLRGAVGYKAQDFEYLKSSGCFTLGAGVDEVANFVECLGALSSFGVDSAEGSDLFGALMAVLHIGNVAFRAPSNNSEGSEPTHMDGHIATACGLLGVDAAALSAAWCTKTIKAPGQGVIRSALPVAQAVQSRDALARHLYAAVFAFIVERVNDAVSMNKDGQQQQQLPHVGVLDIFGFEFFQNNSLEQLFINYTNELLQKHFNEVIFEHEEELYAREGIQWDPMTFPDNTGSVDVIGKVPTGLLPMLDEECMTVGGSSDGWCSKLLKKHGQNAHVQAVKQRQYNFIVKHFAGPVEYTSRAFLDKNRDQLGADLVACLEASTCDFVRQRFSTHGREFGTRESVDATGARRVGRAKQYTVASEFQNQLKDLMQRIRQTEPHFVRCIKPNPKSLAGVFDRVSVAEQLRYQGVLQAIEVSRAGFPLRLRHKQGTLRFRCLAPRGQARNQLEALISRGLFDQAARMLLAGLSSANAVEASASIAPPESSKAAKIAKAAASLEESWAEGAVQGLAPGDWAAGATLVFFKRRAVELLGSALARRRSTAATRMQSDWRRFSARRKFKELVKSTRQIQRVNRGRAARSRVAVLRKLRAAIRMQCCWRCKKARQVRRHRSNCAALLQAWWFARRFRANFLRKRLNTVRLQKWWRRQLVWLRVRKIRRAATDVQRLWRGVSGRTQANKKAAERFRRRRAGRKLLGKWRAQVGERLLALDAITLASQQPGFTRASNEFGSAAPLLQENRPLISHMDDICRSPQRQTRTAAPANVVENLEGASIGELLAAHAAVKDKCKEMNQELDTLRSTKEALLRQTFDLERWTAKGILVRVAGRIFGDSCGPRAGTVN